MYLLLQSKGKTGMGKPQLAIISMWQCLLGFLSPAFIGIIYMMITGHGKGYDYDLREETGFYVELGIIAVILYFCLIIPGFLWSGKAFCRIKKKTALLPCALFFVGFLITVCWMGFKNFLSFFLG